MMFWCIYDPDNPDDWLNREERIDALIKSNRRINSINIKIADTYVNTDFKQFKILFPLLEIKGRDVKSIALNTCEARLHGFEKEKLNMHRFFELMPNLEKITLEDFFFHFSHEPIKKEFLPKLKELNVIKCNDAVLELFNNLTSLTLLRKIHLTCTNSTRLGSFYSDQRNIKEISFCSCFKTLYNFGTLRMLKKVEAKIHLSDNLESICNDWNSVTDLTLTLEGGDEQFRSLAKLQNLQTLSLFWTRPGEAAECLSKIYSSSLKMLFVRSSEEFLPVLPASTLRLLARNSPILENLEITPLISSCSINAIIENCHSLKKLTCNLDGEYLFKDNLQNDNLTTLLIRRDLRDRWKKMPEGIPRLIGACKMLSSFETTLDVDSERLKALLVMQPNLTTLLLHHHDTRLTIDFIEIIKTYGKKLNHFICNCRNEDIMTEEIVREKFKDDFKYIKLTVRFYTKKCDWEMRKF